jgi:hypothetical protein
LRRSEHSLLDTNISRRRFVLFVSRRHRTHHGAPKAREETEGVSRVTALSAYPCTLDVTGCGPIS